MTCATLLAGNILYPKRRLLISALLDSIDALAPFVHELIGPYPLHESILLFLFLGFYVKQPLFSDILLGPEEILVFLVQMMLLVDLGSGEESGF